MTCYVMVVDDDEALRESVCELLEEEGFRVVGLGDGAAALDRLRRDPDKPDVVLLDLMMPGMNGWQFREEQRRDPAIAQIPVVVMTASRDLQGMQADEVVYKPLKLVRLFEVVRRHARTHAAPEPAPAPTPTRATAAAGREPWRERLRWMESEEQLRRVVDQVQVGIVQLDLDGRFELVNACYCALVNRSHGELRALRLEDVTHPGDRPELAARLRRLLEDGTPFVLEARPARPDGVLVWMQHSVSRIDDADGRPAGLVVIAIDVTQQRLSVLALEESEEKHRQIFENAEVSLWEEDFSELRPLVDALAAEHGAGLRAHLEQDPALVERAIGLVHLRDVNPATLRMFGAADKQTLLASLHVVFLPETMPVFVEEMVAIAERRPVIRAETVLRTLAGERLDVAFTVGFPSGEHGWDRVLVTLMDVSAQKLAANARESRIADMERTVRLSELFVGILGHDLRTPLSAITTSASVLATRVGNDRMARSVHRIVTSAARMERMISQLLDLTRIRLGRGIPLVLGEVDLARVARTIIDELAPVHGRELALEAVGNGVGTWDGDRLSQLLSNLAANACQHGRAGAPVRVRILGADDVVRLEVENDGTIPPELLPGLFEPLRRSGPRSEARSGSSGLGLGLYITQQIALAHGGTIRVESSDAAGTRFIVTLPRRPPSDAADASRERVFPPDRDGSPASDPAG